MVFTNGFLITQVIPANNESYVALDANIRVTFAMDMDPSTITSGTIMLNEANGNAVDTTVSYDRSTKIATIEPISPLQPDVVYQIIVQAGVSGVLTITGAGLPSNMTYAFSTTRDSFISIPSELSVDTSGILPVLSWVQPDSFDTTKQLYYNVAVSTSSLDPDQDPGSVQWPLADDYIANVTGTSIRVTKVLPDLNYYAYVRAYTDTTKSGWVNQQFLISTQPSSTPSSPTAPSSLFEVSETYPKLGAVHIMPDSIKILFTSNLDQTSVTNQSVYVIPGKAKGDLNLMDYLTDFAPSKAIAMTIDPPSLPNVISLSGMTFTQNMYYTVIVRETIKSTSGDLLGDDYYWTFCTALSPLYGDPDKVRADVGSYLTDTPDDVIYQYMHDTSVYVYSIVSAASTFDASKFVPGNEFDQYVRFKTSYDLLTNAYIEMLSSGKGTTKLGELSITRDSDLNDITGFLNDLKLRIKPWEDAVHGLHNRGYAKPNDASKGELSDAYPWISRTTYKSFSR